MVNAYIARDPAGVHRVFCQRARRKWWFELGKHRETDEVFEAALRDNRVFWKSEIEDKTKLF